MLVVCWHVRHVTHPKRRLPTASCLCNRCIQVTFGSRNYNMATMVADRQTDQWDCLCTSWDVTCMICRESNGLQELVYSVHCQCCLCLFVHLFLFTEAQGREQWWQHPQWWLQCWRSVGDESMPCFTPNDKWCSPGIALGALIFTSLPPSSSSYIKTSFRAHQCFQHCCCFCLWVNVTCFFESTLKLFNEIMWNVYSYCDSN